jgi:hypothetical protein
VRRRFTLLEVRAGSALRSRSGVSRHAVALTPRRIAQDDVRNIEGGRVPLPHYGASRGDGDGAARDGVRPSRSAKRAARLG